MPASSPNLRAFLDANPLVARVEVTEARGSTPREAGTWMLVASSAIFGTIGGGQLEFMAIDEARKVLAGAMAPAFDSSPKDGSGSDEAGLVGPAAPSGHLLPVKGEKGGLARCWTFRSARKSASAAVGAWD